MAAFKQDHDGTAAKLSSSPHDIYIPVPNVQWKTPDDGQRNCPKHVEFLDKINLGNQCVCWFYLKRNVTIQHGHMNVKNRISVLD
jgi:hypothetical protein